MDNTEHWNAGTTGPSCGATVVIADPASVVDSMLAAGLSVVTAAGAARAAKHK